MKTLIQKLTGVLYKVLHAGEGAINPVAKSSIRTLLVQAGLNASALEEGLGAENIRDYDTNSVI